MRGWGFTRQLLGEILSWRSRYFLREPLATMATPTWGNGGRAHWFLASRTSVGVITLRLGYSGA